MTVARISSRTVRRIAVAAIVAGVLLDGWPGSFPLAVVPVLRPPHGTAAIARLGLPLAQNETESMYQTIGDGLPVFNGYSGYDAPQHAPLRDLLERRDPAILGVLSAAGTIHIVVEHTLDPDGGWRRFVEAAGARALDSAKDWTRYELPQQARVPRPAVTGTPVRIVHADATVNPSHVNAMFDGDLKTRWHASHQGGSETVTVDLGAARPIRGIVMCLGTHASQYPRALEVDASIDGASWTTVWSGRTALEAYDAAVADPRAIPIPIPVGREARLLRLRQTANEPTRVWTIVELRILE